MRTVNSYISEIRETVAKDYPNLDDRYVLELIDQYRSIYIKNEENKKTFTPAQIKQTIVGIEMDMSKRTYLDFITDNSRILKSKVSLPEVINMKNKDLVLNIYNDKVTAKSFNYISRDKSPYAGNGRYNQKDVHCFIHENFLYIKLQKQEINLNLLNFLTVEAIFEHPIDCIPLQYKDYFDFVNYEYPISETMWGYIKSSILQNSLVSIQSEINEQEK